MPNKTEVWQRIISYCDDPSELVIASRFINRTARLDGTKAMWILRHPEAPLTKQLLTEQILLVILKSDIDYYIHSSFLDSETEELLSALLEIQDYEHFGEFLNHSQATKVGTLCLDPDTT